MRITSLLTVFAVALSLTLFCGCNKKKKGAVKERQVRVTLQKLEKRVFRRIVPVQGTVYPLRYAVISAKIGGVLERLKISEGDVLKKGDTLFEIDRQVLKNQVMVKENEINVKKAELASAKISFERSQINLDKAKLDYDRFARLWKTRATSQTEYENAVVNYKNAEADVKKAEAAIHNANAQLKQAEGNLIIARKNLADSSTKAPYDCTVTKTYFEENEYVSTGNNLVKIEDLTEFEIVTYISAVYYDQIVPGKTAVDITGISGTDRTVVSYKAPGIEPESRTFKIKIAVPAKSGLVSGMLCELNIILTEREGYGLPESAVLLRAENRTIAYTVNAEKRAQSVEVKRGITDGGFCEILNAGDFLDKRFVVAGQTFINNGSLLTEAGAEKK